jgi:hypothetical protein
MGVVLSVGFPFVVEVNPKEFLVAVFPFQYYALGM